MRRDFVDVRIDQDEMVHGKEVAAEVMKDRRSGIPFTVIYDASGEELVELVTSIDPEHGNIGGPVTESEQAWFVEMLRQGRRTLSDEDLQRIARELATYAAPILERMRPAAAPATPTEPSGD